MKTILSTCALIFLLSFSAFGCDRKDPICVAKTLFEKGVTFRFDELKDFHCKSNISGWEIGVLMSESAVKVFKEQGINYREQEFHDFSNVKYKLEIIDKESATVHITGKAIQGFTGTVFKAEQDVDIQYYLEKEEGSNTYCLPVVGNARARKQLTLIRPPAVKSKKVR